MQNLDLITWNKELNHQEIYKHIVDLFTKNKIKVDIQYCTLKDGSKHLELRFSKSKFSKVHEIVYLVVTEKNTYTIDDTYISIN